MYTKHFVGQNLLGLKKFIMDIKNVEYILSLKIIIYV